MLFNCVSHVPSIQILSNRFSDVLICLLRKPNVFDYSSDAVVSLFMLFVLFISPIVMGTIIHTIGTCGKQVLTPWGASAVKWPHLLGA